MSLKLYFHPLSSFCQKVLIALLRERHAVRAAHRRPRRTRPRARSSRRSGRIGKMPVLRDDARDRTIPESSIIIEYLAQHYPGRTQLVPARPGPRAADAPARPLLRPLRERADAEDRHRQAAAGGKERSARRGAGEDAAADRLRHDRAGDGDEDLGHGRRIQHGRLRRRAGAVLRQPGAALRRRPTRTRRRTWTA